jgi:hypothetical protein
VDVRKFFDHPNDADLPDPGEAHVALIDALHDYLRIHEMIGKDLLSEGQITREEFDRPWPLADKCREILSELESAEFDGSLCGLLIYRNGKFHKR